eukprot:6198161-Pleurochrysis_carterae.AAC.6
MHEQLDDCLAALQALGDIPGMIKADEAAWRKYWSPLTELLFVARWRENPTPLTPSCERHDCCAKSCF